MAGLGSDSTGLLWGYAFRGDEAASVAGEALTASLEAPDSWVWLHFRLGDHFALRTIEGLETLPAAARELILEVEQRVQIHFAGRWVYGVLPDVERDLEGRNLGPGRMQFAAGERLLITARRHALRGASDFRHACDRGLAPPTPSAAVVNLIERFMDASEARLRQMSTTLDDIEDRVLREATERDRVGLAPLRRAVSRNHREFLALRSALHRAISPREAHAVAELSRQLPRLAQEAEDLDRDSASLQERTRLLHEEIDTQINSGINRSMRALAIISTLLIPPTLITGAFGMNVGGVPFAGHNSGFLLAGLICLVVVGAAWWLLKRMQVL